MFSNPAARILLTIIAFFGGYFFSSAEAKAQSFSSRDASSVYYHADQNVERAQVGTSHFSSAHSDLGKWNSWAFTAPEFLISTRALISPIRTARAFHVLGAKEFSFRAGLSPPQAQS